MHLVHFFTMRTCTRLRTQVCLQYGAGHEPTSPCSQHHASKPVSAHQGFTLQSFSCSQPPVGGVVVGTTDGVGAGVGGVVGGVGGVGGEGASFHQAHSRPAHNAWTSSTQLSPWLQPAPLHRPTTTILLPPGPPNARLVGLSVACNGRSPK